MNIDEAMVAVTCEDVTLLTPEQFAAVRSDGCIGGSSAGQSVGLGKWGTMAELYDQLYAQLHGNAVPEQEVTAEKQLMFDAGHLAEQNIADRLHVWFKTYYGLELDVFDDHRMFRSKVYPWASANLDRWGVIHHPDGKDETVLIEIKTVQPTNFKAIDAWKSGVVNSQYLCQCLHYMGVMQLAKEQISRTIIVGAWGMGITPESMAVINVPRDQKAIDALFAGENSFWDAVQQGSRPDWSRDDSEKLLAYLGKKYGLPEKNSKAISLPLHAMLPVKQIAEAEARLKELEEEKKRLEATKADAYSALLPYFLQEDRIVEKGQIAGGGHVVEIFAKVPKKRATLDADKFLAEHPEARDAVRAPVDAAIKNWCAANGVDLKSYKDETPAVGKTPTVTFSYKIKS